MGIDHRMVHFRTPELDEVVSEITRIAARGDAEEWVTISPWVDPENLPVVSLLRRIFSGRGSKVPEVTWVPAHGSEPAQLGVVHATGANALDRLWDSGVAVPDSWRKLGDHSRRGLLFAVDPATSATALVEFAVDAARVLASVPTDDRWVAQISLVS